MWGLLRLPRFGGAEHANGYDNRFRYRQVSLSGACWPSGCPPAVEASTGDSVFPETATMPGRRRGVRLLSLLVARAAGAWARRAANAAVLCEAVCQTPEERYGRC